MSLVFDPDRVAYDPQQQALRFFARDDFRLVYCAVSKAALAALEDDALGGAHAMATTYRRHKDGSAAWRCASTSPAATKTAP